MRKESIIGKENVRLVELSSSGIESVWPVAEKDGLSYFAPTPDPNLLQLGEEFSNRIRLLSEQSQNAISITGVVVDLAAVLKRKELVFLGDEGGGWVESMKQGGGLI